MNKWINKSNLIYLISLLPLIIFGIYKNSILVYNKGYIQGIEVLKPFIIILMSITGFLLGKVVRYYVKKDIDNIFDIETIIEAIIMSLVLPIKSSPIIIFIVTLFISFINIKKKINRIALTYLIIETINVLIHANVFSNLYESNTVLNYSAVDIFLGFSSGGIGSTSILLILIGFIILTFNKLYKRDIVLTSTLAYSILVIIPSIINSNYDLIFANLFGYNIFYTYVFVLPNNYSTSYTVKGQVLSGLLVGSLTYFITLLTPYNASMISILLVGLISKIIDRIFLVK